MADIKNIIFDLGGVILNLNYQLTSSAFKKLGVKNFDHYYSQKEQVDLFNSFEKGLISPNEFVLSVQKILPNYISKNNIISAWNSMLLNLPQKRLLLLQELKKSFRLFLLSNTNEIHIEFFEKQMQEAGLSHSADDDVVAEEEKQQLLAHLQKFRGDSQESKKKITLKDQ